MELAALDVLEPLDCLDEMVLQVDLVLQDEQVLDITILIYQKSSHCLLIMETFSFGLSFCKKHTCILSTILELVHSLFRVRTGPGISENCFPGLER